MRFYIATGFARVKEHNVIRDKLVNIGHKLTYDWTLVMDEKSPTIATDEICGVRSADFLVMLLPGKWGTHVEFGAALGMGVKVFLCGWTPEWNCIFYDHPLVTKVAESDLIYEVAHWACRREEELSLLPSF